MQIRANLRGATVGRAIDALTAAYLLMIAALAIYMFDGEWRLAGLIFDELLFSEPMLIAYGIAKLRVNNAARRVLLGFQVGFSLLTFFIFWATFSGEPEAQYQLTLLFIPMIGFVFVAIAGVIAAAVTPAPTKPGE